MNEERAATTALSALDYHNLIRARLEHEDNLIMQRLSWLVASQSFLFTAYAIVLNGLGSPPTLPAGQPFVPQQLALFRLVPVVGILTCGLIYATILAAVASMASLRRLYHSRFSKQDRDDLPAIQAPCAIRRCGLAAPVFLPVVFIVVWLVLWLEGLKLS